MTRPRHQRTDDRAGQTNDVESSGPGSTRDTTHDFARGNDVDGSSRRATAVAELHRQRGNQAAQQLATGETSGNRFDRDVSDSDGATRADTTARHSGEPAIEHAPPLARRRLERSVDSLPPISIDRGPSAQRALDRADGIAAARGTRIIARPGAFDGEQGVEHLAHEVAHVLQQTSSEANSAGVDAAESDAASFARDVSAGRSATTTVSTPTRWALQSEGRQQQASDDPIVAMIVRPESQRIEFQTQSGVTFQYEYTGSVVDAYVGEGTPAGTHRGERVGKNIVIENFEAEQFGRIVPNERNPVLGDLVFASTFQVRVASETSEPTPADTDRTERQQSGIDGDTEGTRRDARAGGGHTGWIQSEFLADIQMIVQEMRTLSNVLWFFAGVVIGAKSEVSLETLAKLDEKYLRAVTQWQFQHWDAYLSGIKNGVVNELKGIYEMVVNIDELLTTAIEMFEYVATEATPPTMRQAGRQVGQGVGKRVERLLNSSGADFMRQLGEVLAPLILELLVSLASSGVGAGLKAAKVFGKLAEKFPKANSVPDLFDDPDQAAKRLRNRRDRDEDESPEDGDSEEQPTPRDLTLGERQARERGWPIAEEALPEGHHWHGNRGGDPRLHRNPGYGGDRYEYDPDEGTFKRASSSSSRTVSRPRLRYGKKVARLPDSQFRHFEMPLSGDAATAQRRLLRRIETGEQKARDAGKEYQELVAENLGAPDLQEVRRATDGGAGRRMDVGTEHEVTLEGRDGPFSTGKLDQLWLDMRDHGRVQLTVPQLSDEAADQLRRLAAQAQGEFDRKIMVFVRETATDAPAPWE